MFVCPEAGKKYLKTRQVIQLSHPFPSLVWLYLLTLIYHTLQWRIHNQAKALPDHCVVCLSHLSCTSVFIQTAQQTSVEKNDLPLNTFR